MDAREMAGVSVVPVYEGHPCRVCGGPHPARRCQELQLPTGGRECILDGPVFDAFQSVLSAVYKDNCELIAVEVRLSAK